MIEAHEATRSNVALHLTWALRNAAYGRILLDAHAVELGR